MADVEAPDPDGSAVDRPEPLAASKARRARPRGRSAPLSNPAKRNALDHELLDALAAGIGRLDARCLLITGQGEVFSGGYDIGGFTDPERFAREAEQLVAHPFHDAILALERYPYPVVAATTDPPSAAASSSPSPPTCGWPFAARSSACLRPDSG